MTKRIPFLMLSALLVLLSCTQKEGKIVRQKSEDSLTIRLALLPVADCLPFYYAEEEGLFDSVGIRVKLKTYRAAMDADTAFLRGSADAVCTDLVKACIWQSQGDSVTAVMATQLDLYLLTAYSARIRQVSSLKEKIIGITRNSAVDLTTDEILSRARLLSTDLNKPQINNIKLRCYMVDQNQYDGAVLPEPYASECEARGARRVIGTPELGLNLGVVLMKDSTLARHREDIALLRQAYDLAVEQLNERIAAYEQARADTLTTVEAPRLMRYFPRSRSIEIPDSLVRYPTFRPSGQPTDSAFMQAKRWCQGRSLLRRDISLSELLWQDKIEELKN